MCQHGRPELSPGERKSDVFLAYIPVKQWEEHLLLKQQMKLLKVKGNIAVDEHFVE